MVLHSKHLILSKIRDSFLLGDSLDQAKAHCLASGYSLGEINDTLDLYENFKSRLDIKSDKFWDTLTYLIFDFALQFESFRNLINESKSNEINIDLSLKTEILQFINPFRLLDICSYSGYWLTLSIPNYIYEDCISYYDKITPEEFNFIQDKKKILGLNGELFVLQEEINRLGEDFPIEHTSQLNVGAGYDIKSWKNSNSYSKSNRLYIEVKTFSIKKEIFISENELSVAKNLRDAYRLQIVRKVGDRFENYRVIDNFYEFYCSNISVFDIQPTFRYRLD